MFPVALLLLMAAESYVKCETLTQPASLTVQPGQSLTIACQVSYSVSSYWTAWVRQPAGRGLEWIGSRVPSSSYYKDSLKNKFSIDVDSSSNTLTLKGQNMQPGDTAVYYCARTGDGWGGLPDYWGPGTEVTVQSETATAPSLFPLVQCAAGTESDVTVGCLARNFAPKSISFQWSDADGSTLDSVQYPLAKAGGAYTGVSLVRVSKPDWNSGKSFTCSAAHSGSRKTVQVQKPAGRKTTILTLVSVPSGASQALVCTIEDSVGGGPLAFRWEKNGVQMRDSVSSPMQPLGGAFSAISFLKVNNTEWDSEAVYTCVATYKGSRYIKKTSKAPTTVTLSQPSPRRIFNDNQAELSCVVTGQDMDTTEVTWQVDGQAVNGSHGQVTQQGDGRQSKISTMTLGYATWVKAGTVRCSASRDDMTPVVQELTVQKGGGSAPQVAVHILLEEDTNSAEVTMVCLVTAAAPRDYYIAWTEHDGQRAGNYADGVDFPPKKTASGYAVASVYTAPRSKWERKVVFYCHVWPAGSAGAMKSRGVSKATGNSIECNT